MRRPLTAQYHRNTAYKSSYRPSGGVLLVEGGVDHGAIIADDVVLRSAAEFVVIKPQGHHRLGRLPHSGDRGTGVYFVIPPVFVDEMADTFRLCARAIVLFLAEMHKGDRPRH